MPDTSGGLSPFTRGLISGRASDVGNGIRLLRASSLEDTVVVATFSPGGKGYILTRCPSEARQLVDIARHLLDRAFDILEENSTGPEDDLLLADIDSALDYLPVPPDECDGEAGPGVPA